MDTKALRQKILDLAIRGKLVPQDPNDEPASVLLERIRAEKQQMVKEGKLKAKDIKNDTVIFVGEDNLHYEKFPDGSVKCIEEEIPFALPQGWEWCRLQHFVDFIGGSQPPKSTFEYVATEENIRLIQIRDYKSNNYLTYIPRSKAKRFCNKNDIMIGRYGPPIFQILRGLEGAYNVALMKAVANSCIIINDYLFYLLQDSKLLKTLESFSDRTCGQDGINMYELNRYIVGIPPIAEQLRIIHQLETIFPIIDSITANKEILGSLINQTKSKILDLAIRGKLVPQDPNDEPASVLLERIRAEKENLIKQGKIKRDKKESVIFRGEDNSYYRISSYNKSYREQLYELPANWSICTLPDIAKIDLGKTLDTSKNTGKPHSYLRSVNVRWCNIDLSDLKEMLIEDEELERYSVQKNDLLICEGGDVGRSCVWTSNETICYQNALHRVRLYDKCNPFFFMYYMMHYESKGIIKDMCKGVTIKHLTGNVLSTIPFSLPPVSEQNRIVNAIESAFAQLDEIANAIA